MQGLVRGVGVRGAIAINAITMIGIGPLITIPLVLGALHGPYSIVGWVGGALLAACDGLVWAELGSAVPSSGATYGYILAAFGEHRIGKLLAFLFVWQTIFVAPLTFASGCVGFANYLGYLFPAVGASALLGHVVAMGVGLVTVAILYRGVASAARIGTWLGIVACATLAIVSVAAFMHFDARTAFAWPAHETWTGALRTGLGAALVIAMYDYVGYGQANYLGEEVERPGFTLPRAILAAVGIVAVLYIGMQIGILGAVRWQDVVPAADGTVPPLGAHLGSTIVQNAFGPIAGIIATILILITAGASLFGILLGASRVPFAAARDGMFLPAFSHVHPRLHIPDVALLTMGGVAVVACWFSLDQLIAALTAAAVIVGSLAQIAALFALRARGNRGPYRMWLYPVPAIVAALGWVYIFASAGSTAILFGLGTLAVGTIVYLGARL